MTLPAHLAPVVKEEVFFGGTVTVVQTHFWIVTCVCLCLYLLFLLVNGVRQLIQTTINFVRFGYFWLALHLLSLLFGLLFPLHLAFGR